MALGNWMSGAAMLVVGAGGCNPKGGETGGGGGACTPSSNLIFLDSNNYSFTADLQLKTASAQSATNLTIDWSAFTVDFRGRPIEPTDVDQVTIASFNLEQAELIDRINANSVLMSDIGAYYQAATLDATSATFDEFSILSNNFPYETDFVEGFATTWLLTIWKENAQGKMEILSSQFVEPTADGADTVNWTNDAAVLDFDPDLTHPPICATADSPPYSLNWAGVTTDVNGAPYDDLKGSLLRISHLPVEDLASAEDLLLRLDIEADETYFISSYATLSIDDLSGALALDGTPFPGFSKGGTWLADITCTDLACFSPAPLLLAVVEVH